MKILTLFSLLLLSSCVFSQRTIKGRVVNESNGNPIPSGSVFISNTSKGTVCNSEGQFQLNDVPSGKHELVVSSIGYETNVFSFSDEQLPLQLKIELKVKVRELENVTVEPSVIEGWDKWGRMFMSNFFGTTSNAAQCRVQNEQALKFRFYKKSNRLIAFADEPIQIENKALGYLINYQLENFEVNFNDRSMSYMGFSLYEPMEKDRKTAEKWQKRREEAYNGSIMHFMRCLYNNRLQEEGFEVRRMKRTPNYEKQRVRPAYVKYRNSQFDGGKVKLPRDTVSYYESVMRQSEYIDIYGFDLLNADSLVVQSAPDYKVLSYDEFILITYIKEKEDPEYVRFMSIDKKPGAQTSFVILLNDKIISIDKSGNYYDPRDFFASGYWSWNEKMANTLPLDYIPD